MHYLPDYNDQLAQYLSESLEAKVAYDSISSQWEGFDPILRVHGLTIGEQEQLSIGRVSLNFSLFQSVLNLQPKFDRILIERADMSITQNNDGHWQLLGFNTSEIKPATDHTDDANSLISELLSFFNGTTINAQELAATIYNDTGKVRTLRSPKLNVNYKNEQLFASGQLLESRGEKTLLNFSLKSGGLLSKHKLKGTLFIEARSSEFFGELLSVYEWNNISIQDVEASGRAWVNFEGLSINSIYGDMQVRQINWLVQGGSVAPVNDLAFAYLWQNEDEDKKLSIENLAFDFAGLECESINARILFLVGGVNLEADKIELNCINQLMLSMGILPEKLGERLSVSNPTGFLSHINFRYLDESLNADSKSTNELSLAETSLNNSSRFEFEAMLSNVNIDAFESTPSGKNIDGYVFATNGSGFVSFLSEDFELGFPTLFLDPFKLRRAEGTVTWDIDQDDVTISSDGLRLWREAESLIYGDFTLRLNDQESEDYIHLALGMQDILFPEAVNFVPYHLVENGLYSWLKESLIAGAVSSGIYYGYGSVESLSAANSFTSSISLKSSNGVLMFDENWPYLEELNADIVIQNAEVWIDSKQATIAATKLNDVQAFLPKGNSKKANFIDISANSLLTKELINYWLSESPISNNTKDIANQLMIDAGAKVDINLRVPVSQAEGSDEQNNVEYIIHTQITDGAITHKPSKLNFSAVNGSVRVDSKTGVNAKTIKANLFDEPVSLSINSDFRASVTKPKLEADQVTKLFLKGKLDLDSIFNYFDTSKPDFISGKLAYLAELTLSNNEKQYPLLTINSDLKGISCQCPQPFDKKASEAQSLALSLLLKPEQSYLEGNLVSVGAPKINAELLFVNDQLTFGEFLIGEAQVKNTDIKGINIAANLDFADLSVWIDFIQAALESKSVVHNTVKIPETISKEENTKDIPNDNIVKQIQVDIDKLKAFDHIFQQSKLEIRPFEQTWQINISGKDAVGRILLEDSDKKLNLQFEKLNLTPLLSEEEPVHVESDKIDINPKDFPPLAFNAKNLLLESRPIGRWQFDILPDDSGSIFRNIKGHIKGSNITGQLNWRNNGGVHSTIATLSLNGEDVASVFDAFDFPILMTSSRYNTDLALVWPESPLNFSVAQLSGNASLSLEDGFLKTEDQKTGVLRLFGILNAESIKRRLKLDFSDLYKSGVGYDTFVAKASMDQGLLTLTEPLVIDGPAGKYTLNGRSDLATKTLDIDMLVELPFSQNVPLAALVLGAPQIGGLVWVADKLLGEPLSALTTSRYDITGAWEKPRVDLKQAMNASKKDRSNEKGSRNVGKPPE